MSHHFFNDQNHIAESFRLVDEHTEQIARIASFKINSYKLSLVNAAFCNNQVELYSLLKTTLLNYTNPGRVLADIGFFASPVEN